MLITSAGHPSPPHAWGAQRVTARGQESGAEALPPQEVVPLAALMRGPHRSLPRAPLPRASQERSTPSSSPAHACHAHWVDAAQAPQYCAHPLAGLQAPSTLVCSLIAQALGGRRGYGGVCEVTGFRYAIINASWSPCSHGSCVAHDSCHHRYIVPRAPLKCHLSGQALWGCTAVLWPSARPQLKGQAGGRHGHYLCNLCTCGAHRCHSLGVLYVLPALSSSARQQHGARVGEPRWHGGGCAAPASSPFRRQFSLHSHYPLYFALRTLNPARITSLRSHCLLPFQLVSARSHPLWCLQLLRMCPPHRPPHCPQLPRHSHPYSSCQHLLRPLPLPESPLAARPLRSQGCCQPPRSARPLSALPQGPQAPRHSPQPPLHSPQPPYCPRALEQPAREG